MCRKSITFEFLKTVRFGNFRIVLRGKSHNSISDKLNRNSPVIKLSENKMITFIFFNYYNNCIFNYISNRK